MAMQNVMKFTTDDLLAATEGRLLVSNNTAGQFRLRYEPEPTTPDDVFVAYQRRKQLMHYTVPGVDTHDSLVDLWSKGCRRFIIDQPHYDDLKFRRVLDEICQNDNQMAFVIVVDSGIEAFFNLATFVRQKINPHVVAVTGSIGKTTTTEMVNAILSLQGETLKNTIWNSNTATSRALLGMSIDTKYAAIELSTRRTGLMQTGSKITRPDIAIITQIQHEHVRGMGSLDGIAKEKLSIAAHMADDAPLILPDIPVIKRHVKSDAQMTYIQADAFKTITHDRNEYTFIYRGHQYRLNVPGRHNVVNALSAIEACLLIGLSPEEIAEGLDNYAPIGNRWLIHDVFEELAVINDCPNNPSPASTRASIATLVSVYSDRQKVVILSDCLELGDEEQELHEELGRFINEQPIDVVITFGEIADTVARAISNPGIRVKSFNEPLNKMKDFEQCSDQIDFILGTITSRCAVLVKAQRITGFNKLPTVLVERLRQRLSVDTAQEPTARIATATPKPQGNSEFLERVRRQLRNRQVEAKDSRLRQLFDDAALPQSFWGFAVTIYQPGVDRLMVVRAAQADAFENIRQVIQQIPKHPRFNEFDLSDPTRCRMQVDFIVEEPVSVEFLELSDSVLPETRGASGERLGTREASEEIATVEREDYALGSPTQVQVVSTWPVAKRLTRFELGVDGLRIVKEGKRRYFLPGDAFVKSILGMGQLRRHVQRLFPGDDIGDLMFYRFRSLSFVSGVEEGTWIPLYRGMPPVPEVDDDSLMKAARAGTKWIADNMQSDGRFTYYYDAATDTRRDHEHPARDPETNPYYNLLRHSGGVVTLLLEEAIQPSSPRRRELIERACDFFVEQLVEYSIDEPNSFNGKPKADASRDSRLRLAVKQEDEEAEGSSRKSVMATEAAYALYNRKAKLGGSGIGLYSLALYQRLFDDDRYANDASRLANHVANEVNEQGEFRYYHLYLDQPVAWDENGRYFSFYYPGEAILGLSHYCQHVCQADTERKLILDKTHQALRFLLRDRPRLHKEHYQSLPSDSWLMMGINDLWDVEEFREDEYKQFVFDDADQMVRLMYTEEDTLYPDYVGSFYYHYGDHPYPDGARAEGLLAAYQLALKVGDHERIERFGNACQKIALALLRLCNTPDSVYSAANPGRAIGGIRFKLTRQWFRVDTIQHVASFYLKLLVK
jgi:UDP-N-acetylmuramyl pentapeptide synthase